MSNILDFIKQILYSLVSGGPTAIITILTMIIVGLIIFMYFYNRSTGKSKIDAIEQLTKLVEEKDAELKAQQEYYRGIIKQNTETLKETISNQNRLVEKMTDSINRLHNLMSEMKGILSYAFSITNK